MRCGLGRRCPRASARSVRGTRSPWVRLRWGRKGRPQGPWGPGRWQVATLAMVVTLHLFASCLLAGQASDQGAADPDGPGGETGVGCRHGHGVGRSRRQPGGRTPAHGPDQGEPLSGLLGQTVKDPRTHRRGSQQVLGLCGSLDGVALALAQAHGGHLGPVGSNASRSGADRRLSRSRARHSLSRAARHVAPHAHRPSPIAHRPGVVTRRSRRSHGRCRRPARRGR